VGNIFYYITFPLQLKNVCQQCNTALFPYNFLVRLQTQGPGYQGFFARRSSSYPNHVPSFCIIIFTINYYFLQLYKIPAFYSHKRYKSVAGKTKRYALRHRLMKYRIVFILDFHSFDYTSVRYFFT